MPGTHAPVAGHLKLYLSERQEALVDRSIEIAKTHGYAPFTTTIRAAWVEAIQSVTEGVTAFVADDDAGPSGPVAAMDYAVDPRFSRMRRIARLHRSLGITMQMYLGLFKHFRNIYLDAVEEFDGAPDSAALRSGMRDFFDETELSISADWTDNSGNHRLRELQDRTRTLTLDKDRYFAIFESLHNPAFLLDRGRDLVNANLAAAELFLGDAQAGDIVYLRSMRRRKSTLQTALQEVLDAARHPDQTVWLDTLAGPRCFDVRMRALHDAVENTALGFVLLLNDVTAHQRAVEQAQQAERQMSRFLATMSHEIRTPLHSVLGATDLLRTTDQHGHANYLDVIESAGQSLLQTLNNVLDYSKLENSPPVARPVATDLRRAVEAFRRVAAVSTKGHMPPVSSAIATCVPRLVGIDWAMTRQVLTNLVSNAIRFDDGRGVRVDVSLPAESMLRFDIRDHGPGISESDAATLAQPFSQIDARDTGDGGAGLGLAISHHLVEAMGGRIGCENLDEGARVWFEIPLTADLAEPAPAQEGAGAEPCRQRHDRFCLLIDDDRAGSIVTARQLELLGFSVDRVGTVASARQRAATQTYDVFVVDYLLPDGDGPSLAKSLASMYPLARIVAFTANIEAVKGPAVAHDVFDAVLAKPADLAALSDALREPAVPQAITPPIPAAAPIRELSPETARAMTQAFAEQWRAFRAEFMADGTMSGIAALGQTAHRLAGSSAILGLSPLEAPLRALEKQCAAGAARPEILVLLGDLDVDLSSLACWREISDVAGDRSPDS